MVTGLILYALVANVSFGFNLIPSNLEALQGTAQASSIRSRDRIGEMSKWYYRLYENATEYWDGESVITVANYEQQSESYTILSRPKPSHLNFPYRLIESMTVPIKEWPSREYAKRLLQGECVKEGGQPRKESYKGKMMDVCSIADESPSEPSVSRILTTHADVETGFIHRTYYFKKGYHKYELTLKHFLPKWPAQSREWLWFW